MSLASPVTADELLHMRGEVRRELVRGVVREKALRGCIEGLIIANVGATLRSYARREQGVVVGAGTGFWLTRNPDTVRAADVAFVRRERNTASRIPTGYWPGAPDLAVEVVSPNDTLQEVEDKVDDYLSAGALMVWVVNPRRKTVTLHVPGGQPIVLHQGDVLDAQTVVPGFRCRVAELFG